MACIENISHAPLKALVSFTCYNAAVLAWGSAYSCMHLLILACIAEQRTRWAQAPNVKLFNATAVEDLVVCKEAVPCP